MRPAAGPAGRRRPVFARFACAPVSRRFASCHESRRPASRPARQGGPAPCVMECHVLSWSPCGQFIAIRQFGNSGADPPGLPGIASSAWIPPFEPRSRHAPAAGPAALRNPVFARIARPPARARYAAARPIAPAPAREGEAQRARLPVAAKAAGPPAARPGREVPRPVSWNVMSCHGLHAGSSYTLASSVMTASFRPAPPASRLRHGALLSSLVRAMRPPPARPCCGTLFRAYRVRACPRALRGGAPDCACARARGRGAARRSPAGLPATAKAAGPPADRPGREAPRPVSWNVMLCHGLHAGSS